MYPAYVGYERFLKGHPTYIIRIFVYGLVPETQSLFKPIKTQGYSVKFFHDDVGSG
jgi:hypothetical protein